MGGWHKEESFSNYTVLYAIWNRLASAYFKSVWPDCAKFRTWNSLAVFWWVICYFGKYCFWIVCFWPKIPWCEWPNIEQRIFLSCHNVSVTQIFSKNGIWPENYKCLIAVNPSYLSDSSCKMSYQHFQLKVFASLRCIDI